MNRDEGGSSLVETFFLALILFVPLLWALGILAELHRGALATSAAAREAGLEAARSSDTGSAERAVTTAVRRALVDHGVDPGGASVRWSTAPGFPRGAAVEVVVSYPVSVTQAPFLGEVSGPSIIVRASHVARIDPYADR